MSGWCTFRKLWEALDELLGHDLRRGLPHEVIGLADRGKTAACLYKHLLGCIFVFLDKLWDVTELSIVLLVVRFALVNLVIGLRVFFQLLIGHLYDPFDCLARLGDLMVEDGVLARQQKLAFGARVLLLLAHLHQSLQVGILIEDRLGERFMIRPILLGKHRLQHFLDFFGLGLLAKVL